MPKSSSKPGQRRYKKGLSRIFIAGAGSIREVRPAVQRSEALKRNRAFSVAGKSIREFRGIDFKDWNAVFDAEKAITKAFKGKPPISFVARQECATKMLLDLPPESQKVVFASYTVNNMPDSGSSCYRPGVGCIDAFIDAAKSRLVPGGRIILVQDKARSERYSDLAKKHGLAFSLIELPEKATKASPAIYIRLRSTPERRIKYIERNYHIVADPRDLNPRRPHPDPEVRKLLESGAISSVEEYAKPVAIILKKPRETKTTKKS